MPDKRTRDTLAVVSFLLPLGCVGLILMDMPILAAVLFIPACLCRYVAWRPAPNGNVIRRGPVREVRRWLHADDLETVREGEVTVEFYRRPIRGGTVVTRIYTTPEGT